MVMRVWGLLGWLLLGGLPLAAGEAHLTGNLKFERLGISDGLSQSSINHIFQDRVGFLWVSTADGLNRYDGYTFKVFRHESFNPDSLPSGQVLSVFQQRDGTLWVVTVEGLCIMRDDGMSFQRLPHPDLRRIGSPNGVSLYEDSRHRLWVYSTVNGGFLLRWDGQGFVTCFGSAARPVAVVDLKNDREGRLWALTSEGLKRYDEAAGTFGRAASPGDTPMLLQGESRLVRDDFGAFWINSRRGLFRLDPDTESMTYHALPQPSGVGITGMGLDQGGFLWLVVAGGIYRYDPAGDVFTAYMNDPDDPHSAPADVRGGVLDRSGVLWLVAFGRGIARFDRERDHFLYESHDPTDPRSVPSNFLTLLFEDRGGTLWGGGPDAGLFKHSPAREKFRHYLHPHRRPKPITSAMVWSLLVDCRGETWVGTDRDGLLRLDARREEIAAQFHPGRLVRGLFQDPEGRIWYGLGGTGNLLGGLYRLNPATGDTVEMLPTNLASLRGLPDGSGFLASCFGRGLWQYTYADNLFKPVGEGVIAHAVDAVVMPDGRLLVGGYAGLFLYDRKTQRAEVFTYDEADRTGLSWNQVMSMYLDEAGTVWLALSGGGLNRFYPDTHQFDHYSHRDGLPNDFVYSILPDEDGSLWLSTNGGLTRMNPATGHFRNYDIHDGLQSMEFNMGAAARAPDGELLFGGVAGFNAFYPRDVRLNRNPPNVIVSAHVGPDQPVRDAAGGAELDLPAGTPMVAFTYAGLDYVEPSKNTYAYRLDGFDTDWQQVGKRRRADYTNLPGGDYVFRVKAANSDGIWSESSAAVRVTVAPHFYETPAFFVGAAAAFGALLLLLFLRQRLRLQRRQEEALLLRDHLRKSEELEYARRLQLAMIPKKDVRLDELEVMGQMITATEVGGDYFDFFRLDEKRLCIAYGDATGHGVAAGLVVGMVKLAATVWAMNPKRIEDMMRDLNQGLRQTLPVKSMGMGLGLAVIDLSTYEVEICSSGMPFPYHYEAADSRLRPLTLKGPPLGYLKRITPATTRLQLARGDRLIFLSDGFMERFNAEGRLWGEKALADSLRTACREVAQPAHIAARLIEDCNRFAGLRACDDDMTVVVMQRAQEAPAEAAAPGLTAPARV